MTTNLRAIAAHAPGYPAMDALEAAGVTDTAHIKDYSSLNPPGFGHTSQVYLAIALAKEITRLHKVINAFTKETA